MTDDARHIANTTWEALYRTQATVTRELLERDIWEGLSTREYAVLMALAAEPEGLRVTELGQDVLISQPGMSKLIDRLMSRELVERCEDEDARARRVRLTKAGVQLQARMAAAIAEAAADILGRGLSTQQQIQLRELVLAVLNGVPTPFAAIQRKAMERNMK